MKKLIYLIGIIFLISCTKSKEERLITDYEQTSGNTITNLNLKFVKIQFVKNITSQDSLKIHTIYLNEQRKESIRSKEKSISLLEESIVSLREMEDKLVYINKSQYSDILEQDEKYLQDYKQELELLKVGFEGTYLEKYNNFLDVFRKNLDSILCKEYDVIYTFNNPSLNNVEQTISKKYYFDSEINNVIKVVNDTIK